MCHVLVVREIILHIANGDLREEHERIMDFDPRLHDDRIHHDHADKDEEKCERPDANETRLDIRYTVLDEIVRVDVILGVLSYADVIVRGDEIEKVISCDARCGELRFIVEHSVVDSIHEHANVLSVIHVYFFRLLVDEHDNFHSFKEIESYVASTDSHFACLAEVLDREIEER